MVDGESEKFHELTLVIINRFLAGIKPIDDVLQTGVFAVDHDVLLELLTLVLVSHSLGQLLTASETNELDDRVDLWEGVLLNPLH